MQLTRLRSGVVGDALALNGFSFHLGLGVVVLVAGVSHAQVIDFEDNAVPQGTQLTLTSDVISGGFLFDLLTDHGHLSNAGVLAGNPWNTDNSGTYLVTDDFNGPNLLTMSPVAGSTFALFSIDFAEWLGTLAAGANADFPATSVEVTGFLQGGGTLQQTVIMDFINDGDGPLNDFQTEFFDATWTNLTHVEFDGVGGFDSYFVIDNIAVPAAGCLDVTTQEIICGADGTTFTVNIEGINACTGGTSMFTFTASGGAVGEELCFTLLVDDGGFCCSTEICVTIPNCTSAALPSDLDGDGIVGMVDFLVLLAAWGSCSDCGNCPANFDGDCSVGILDLLILLGNWD